MPARSQPIRFHRNRLSGHSHRVELLLSLLGLPFEPVDVAFGPSGTRSPAFLAINPLGQIPVIEDGEYRLADSGAILTYLALRYDDARRWLPADPAAAGQTQRWLSLATRQLAEGPATARVGNLFKREIDWEKAHSTARTLFTVVETQVADRSYLTGAAPTIADLAHYGYTAHAPEGGISLDPYPGIRAWLARIEALPGFVAMPRSAVGLAA
jgi:glutathione S-transferase